MAKHAYPLNDLRKHQMHVDCWCKPAVHWTYYSGEVMPEPFVCHNSADGRERLEESVPGYFDPEKCWKTEEGLPYQPEP